MAGERGEGKRGNELLGRLRHHHVHIQRLALQGSHQFSRLISGNASGDTDRDLHSDDCTTGVGKLFREKRAGSSTGYWTKGTASAVLLSVCGREGFSPGGM